MFLFQTNLQNTFVVHISFEKRGQRQRLCAHSVVCFKEGVALLLDQALPPFPQEGYESLFVGHKILNYHTSPDRAKIGSDSVEKSGGCGIRFTKIDCNGAGIIHAGVILRGCKIEALKDTG